MDDLPTFEELLHNVTVMLTMVVGVLWVMAVVSRPDLVRQITAVLEGQLR